MRFRIFIERDEDGAYTASVPELSGCISQGKSRNEALTNISNAIKGYLFTLKKHSEPIPLSILKELVEINA